MTDDDQTTPDTERAERLAEARAVAQDERSYGCTQANSDMVALDDEITRLTGLLAERDAAVQRVRDLCDSYRSTWVAFGLEHLAAPLLAALTAALAPQEPTS